jgi:hypothetical protein
LNNCTNLEFEMFTPLLPLPALDTISQRVSMTVSPPVIVKPLPDPAFTVMVQSVSETF